EAADVEELPGFGIRGIVDGRACLIGRRKFVEDAGLVVTAAVEEAMQRLRSQGKTVSLIGWNGQVVGLVALQDTMRPNAADMIAALRRAGIRKVVLLTGDNRETGEAFGRAAGCDEVY